MHPSYDALEKLTIVHGTVEVIERSSVWFPIDWAHLAVGEERVVVHGAFLHLPRIETGDQIVVAGSRNPDDTVFTGTFFVPSKQMEETEPLRWTDPRTIRFGSLWLVVLAIALLVTIQFSAYALVYFIFTLGALVFAKNRSDSRLRRAQLELAFVRGDLEELATASEWPVGTYPG